MNSTLDSRLDTLKLKLTRLQTGWKYFSYLTLIITFGFFARQGVGENLVLILCIPVVAFGPPLLLKDWWSNPSYTGSIIFMLVMVTLLQLEASWIPIVALIVAYGAFSLYHAELQGQYKRATDPDDDF